MTSDGGTPVTPSQTLLKAEQASGELVDSDRIEGRAAIVSSLFIFGNFNKLLINALGIYP